MRTRSNRIIIATALAAVAIPAAVAGGKIVTEGPPGSPDNPLVASGPDASVVAAADQKGHFNEAKPPTAEDLQEQALSQKPCDLVTKADAGDIIGVTVDATEAPLGPSCVFRSSNPANGFASVAIQTLADDQVKALTKGLDRLDVSGKTAYCGMSTAATLYVSLSGDRVLTIGAADCDVAKRLAGKALGEITRTP